MDDHLTSLFLFVLPRSQAMAGRSAAARRPPYFWAENDGKKKEGDATERERESGGAVTFTDGLKKD